MNIFPMRSVRDSRFKYIMNLQPDAWHTNHSDRQRKDGAGAYWDSWDKAAAVSPEAAAIIEAYYTRPQEELFDLENDPLELQNLIADPSLQEQRERLRNELANWIESQDDDLQPHRTPYPRSRPLPDLKGK